jgi:hypothetical protein
MALSDQSKFTDIAAGLRQSIDSAQPKLKAISDADAAKPRAAGKWSPKQIIGHLLDSAANNHQRFVRVQQGQPLTWTSYDQNHWVDVSHHHARRWDELVALWHAYNQHLAHIIAHLPEKIRGTKITVGDHEPETIEFVVHDYLRHLEQHLEQISITK